VSFLDNLENNLKALESLEPGGIDQSKRREAEHQLAVAAAPWAEKLKSGPYVQKMMQQASRAGFSRRMKISLIWIGTTFRLEARDQRLELRPGATGITAFFVADGEELRREPVDLTADPKALLDRWIAILDERKKRDDAILSTELAGEDL
jgi:hypothetical protein